MPPVKTKVFGKKETYPNAFITYKRRGSNKKAVYERKTRKKYPLQMLFGPGIASLFARPENEAVMQRTVRGRFAKEFTRNIQWYVGRK